MLVISVLIRSAFFGSETSQSMPRVFIRFPGSEDFKPVVRIPERTERSSDQAPQLVRVVLRAEILISVQSLTISKAAFKLLVVSLRCSSLFTKPARISSDRRDLRRESGVTILAAAYR